MSDQEADSEANEVPPQNFSEFINQFCYNPSNVRNCGENTSPNSCNPELEELALKQSAKRRRKFFEVETVPGVSKQQRFKQKIQNSLSKYSYGQDQSVSSSSQSTPHEPNISFEYLQTNSFDERQQNDVVFNYDPVFDQPLAREIDEGNMHEGAASLDQANIGEGVVGSLNFEFEDDLIFEDPAVLNNLLLLEQSTDEQYE